MSFIIICLILTCLYTLLFNLIPLSPWFNFLWVFLGLILAIITLALFIIIFIFTCPKNNPKGSVRHWLLRNVSFITIKFLNIKLIVEGRENIPSNETFVFYANHKSMMDPILVYYAGKTKISAVGKSTLFKNKLMENVRQTFDAISLNRENDREAAKAIVGGIKKVKNGLPMIIFPEGGIKDTSVEEMVNLKAGAYKLACKAEAKIVPVSIIGSSQIKDSYIKRKKIKIVFHKAISKEEYKDKNTTEIGTYVESIINEAVKNDKES